MIGWIGALLGVAASVRSPPDTPRIMSGGPGDLQASHDRLAHEVEALAHSREQLRAHIEYLERELATQRSMADHWLRQCQTAMRERRAIEDERDRLRDGQWTSLGLAAQQTQATMAQAQQMLAQQYAPLGGLGPVMTPYDILRNCSPGRSHALVNQLNEAGR